MSVKKDNHTEAKFEDLETLEEMEKQLNLDQDAGEDDSRTANDENDEDQEDASSDEGEESDETTEESDKQQELILGRFKSQQDLAEAYRHIETRDSQSRNELHQLRQELDRLKTRRSPDEEIQEFATKIKKNPVEAIRELSRQELSGFETKLKRQQAQEHYKRLQSVSDFNELEPVMVQISDEVKDLIEGRPEVANDPRTMNLLYWAAKGMKTEAIARQAETKGLKKGAESQKKKTRTKLEGSSGSTNRTQPDFDTLSLEEMEKSLASRGLV